MRRLATAVFVTVFVLVSWLGPAGPAAACRLQYPVVCEGGDLAGADFANRDLTLSHMPNANLAGADFSGAMLVLANLEGADLRRADLSGANLSNAFLTGANLEGANLEGAVLVVAGPGKTLLEGARLKGARNCPPEIADRCAE